MKKTLYGKILYKLVKDSGFSRVRAGIAADLIMNFDSRLDGGVENWLAGKADEPFTAGDFNTASVMNAVGCDYLESLFIINAALADPARMGKFLLIRKSDKVMPDEK